MTDRINELKALIEKLDADSALRKQLEDALNAELKRTDQAEVKAERKAEGENHEATSENNTETDNDSENSQSNADDLDEKLDELLKGLDGESSTITEKLEELMNNDEFITASAGFVLGAAAATLGAVAIAALKK